MTDHYESTLSLVSAEMDDGAPTTPRQLLQNDIAQRLSGVLYELDYLIALSRDFDAPEIQQAIVAEEKDFLAIMFRTQLLCSFIEASRPQGLRLVGRTRR